MNHAEARLTIGIPLHRSRRWVDVVSANIDAVTRTDVEIVVSDRTLLDDALDVLARRHGDDPRVALIGSADGADWVEHCNGLLRHARGTYFCWMPHDDSFPTEWVDVLVAHLDADPDLLMAFGDIAPIAPDDTEVVRLTGPPPVGNGNDAPEIGDARALLVRWNPGFAFRGVFRREAVVRNGLFIPRLRGGVDADSAWVFGMAMLGRLRFVPAVATRKRYHDGNAHASWRRDVRHRLALGRVQASYAARYPGSVRAKAIAVTTVAGATARPVAGVVRNRVRRAASGVRRIATE